MSRLNMQETRAEYEVWKRDYFGGMDRKMDEAAWAVWKHLTEKLENAGAMYVNKNAECLALREALDAAKDTIDSIGDVL